MYSVNGMTAKDETTLEACLASRAEDLELLSNGAKVRCKRTGHEMPALLEKVIEYVNSKKFLKAKAGTKTMEDLDFSKYEPHIVQHNANSKMLYCSLTKQKLAKVISVVEKHVNGRRFKEALKQHDEQAAKPKPEKRKFGKGKGKGSDAKKAKTEEGGAKPTKGDVEGAKDAEGAKNGSGGVKDQAAGKAEAGKTTKKKVKRKFLRRDREAAKKMEIAKTSKENAPAKKVGMESTVGNGKKKKIKMKKSPKLAGH